MGKAAPWRRLEAHIRRCRHGKSCALVQVGGAHQKMSTWEKLRPGASWRRTSEDVDMKKVAPWR
ncbi:hypothetical protein KI387_006679, partial [Taxus chinensis]